MSVHITFVAESKFFRGRQRRQKQCHGNGPYTKNYIAVNIYAHVPNICLKNGLALRNDDVKRIFAPDKA